MKIVEKRFYNYLSTTYNLRRKLFRKALREKYWRWQGRLDREENLYMAGHLSRFYQSQR